MTKSTTKLILINDLAIYTSFINLGLYIIHGLLLFFLKEGVIFTLLGLMACLNLMAVVIMLVLNLRYKYDNFTIINKKSLFLILASGLAILLYFGRGGILRLWD
jgi:hypothetical protein